MHEVTVTFKPKGVPKYQATEVRTATFTVQDAISMPRSELTELSKEALMSEQDMDADILRDYWEIWDYDIQTVGPTATPFTPQPSMARY